jgi:hypothetical protein
MTGLAAGMASGLPVLEAASRPGGICCSYYMRSGSDQRFEQRPDDDGAYRFENGGGHWLFGGEPTVLRFIAGLGPLRRYERRSSVYFPNTRQYVPYPIQNHLRWFDHHLIVAALEEMARPPGPVSTMADWLVETFGDTLNQVFFAPFHDLYTRWAVRRHRAAGCLQIAGRSVPCAAWSLREHRCRRLQHHFRLPAWRPRSCGPSDGRPLSGRVRSPRRADRCRPAPDHALRRHRAGIPGAAIDPAAEPGDGDDRAVDLGDPGSVHFGPGRQPRWPQGRGLPGGPLAISTSFGGRFSPGRVLQQCRRQFPARRGASSRGPGQRLR